MKTNEGAGVYYSKGKKDTTKSATAGGSCGSAAITLQPKLTDLEYTQCKDLAKRSIVNALSPKKGLWRFPYIGYENYQYIGAATGCLIATPVALGFASSAGAALASRILMPALQVIWPWAGYYCGDSIGELMEPSPFNSSWFAELVSKDTVKSCLKPVPSEEDIHTIESSLTDLKHKVSHCFEDAVNQLTISERPHCCGWMFPTFPCIFNDHKSLCRDDILNAVPYLEQALECAKERLSQPTNCYAYLNGGYGAFT